MSDALTAALNAPAGRLAEILLKKLIKGADGRELTDDMRQRLDKLVDAPGKPGRLARVRLASEVSYLFERAPMWTKSKILPLFDWSSAEASDMWSSRKYSNYIGSPELFSLTKQPFLNMFGRSDVSAADMETFSEWLAAILIANQSERAAYPLTPTEARAALRRAGVTALSSVGHRLAMEMEGAKPKERGARWREVVGPVFQAIWPLDVELQTPASTFKLTQILMATGDAFPEAADIIIPFIRPDDPRSHSTVFSIAEAPNALYASSPSKMLDLIAAVVGDASPGSIYLLGKALERIRALDPKLADTRKFQKLINYATPYSPAKQGA
jgi:hypothetical protein